MKRVLAASTLAGVALIMTSQVANAGGLYLYEIGSPDVGYGAAGYAARADNASTVFTNPAGMSRFVEPTVMAGAQPMYLHIDFTPDGNTSAVASTLPGGGMASSGDSNGWIPAGGLFYVQPVNEQLSFGFSLAGNFGLALDYQDNWVGRYYIQDATLQALSIQPTVAWKVNDQFSVGAGLAVLYGMLEQKKAVNNAHPLLADGRLKLEDTEWGVQLNFGILYEPWQGTRFGLTYLSQTDLDFSDTPEFSNLGPGLSGILGGAGLLDATIDLGINVPQALMFSVYQKLGDRLAVLANLGWQDWSEFGLVDVSVDSNNPVDLTTDLAFDDTWHVALGLEYQLNPRWQVTGGVAYDSSMLDDVVPSLPVGETWRFGIGSKFQWKQNITLGAAYELAWSGDLEMDVARGPLVGRVSGTYEDTAIHAFSLNLEYRF